MGCIGTGKTYNFNILAATRKVELIEFKTALIQLIENSFNLKFNTASEYEEFKQSVFGVDIKKSEELLKSFPNLLTGRKILQIVGTEIVRNIQPDYWVNQFKKAVKNSSADTIACCDCRFPNELQAAIDLENEGYKVCFVYCDYPSNRSDFTNTHASEKMAQQLGKFIKKCKTTPTPVPHAVEISTKDIQKFLKTVC